MTTKTGMNDRLKLKYLSRLIALGKSAYDLIANNHRSAREIEALLDALQTFKSGLRVVAPPVKDGSTLQFEMFKAEGKECLLYRYVEDLEFSVRTSNLLERCEIRFIGQLITHTETDFLSKSYGLPIVWRRRSIKEIKEVIGSMGLSLGMSIPPEVQEKLELYKKIDTWVFNHVDNLDGLSQTYVRYLRQDGIWFIGQLVQKSLSDLNYKREMIQEIQGSLRAIGLSLDMTLPPEVCTRLNALVAGQNGDSASAP
jgi:DNA-directed RNA polymerase alpha subunit